MAHKKQKGFTLIELLVVISIIGLLSSIVLASLNSARSKARDSAKMSELRQLATSLERYWIDNGAMPVNTTPGSWCASGQGGCLQELVAGGYFSALPAWINNDAFYYYDYGTYGMVSVHLESDSYGPGPDGWHCSAASPGELRYYCIQFQK